MKPNRPLVRYGICVLVALTCAAAMVVRPPDWKGSRARVSSEPESYLDCTRITSARLREPDLAIVCSVVAEVAIDLQNLQAALGIPSGGKLPAGQLPQAVEVAYHEGAVVPGQHARLGEH